MMRVHSQLHGNKTKTKLKLRQIQQSRVTNNDASVTHHQSLPEKINHLVEWANTNNVHTIYGDEKYKLNCDMLIKNDIEQLEVHLSNCLFYIGLIDSFLPGIINDNNITKGETQQEKHTNASLVIETAQRLGIPMFISPLKLIRCDQSIIIKFLESMYQGWKLLSLI